MSADAGFPGSVTGTWLISNCSGRPLVPRRGWAERDYGTFPAVAAAGGSGLYPSATFAHPATYLQFRKKHSRPRYASFAWNAFSPAVAALTESRALLDPRDLLVQPGFFYDFTSEAYLVLSLLTPPPVFAEGLNRLLISRPAVQFADGLST